MARSSWHARAPTACNGLLLHAAALHMTSSHRCMHAAHVTPVTDALSHASLTLDDMHRPQTLYNTLLARQELAVNFTLVTMLFNSS